MRDESKSASKLGFVPLFVILAVAAFVIAVPVTFKLSKVVKEKFPQIFLAGVYPSPSASSSPLPSARPSFSPSPSASASASPSVSPSPSPSASASTGACYCPHSCQAGYSGCHYADRESAFGLTECDELCCNGKESAKGTCPTKKCSGGGDKQYESGTSICSGKAKVTTCLDGSWKEQDCSEIGFGYTCQAGDMGFGAKCVLPCREEGWACGGDYGDCCSPLKCLNDPLAGQKKCMRDAHCVVGAKRCASNGRPRVEKCVYQGGIKIWQSVEDCQYGCENAVCGQPPCKTKGYSCRKDKDCCGGLECLGFVCSAPLPPPPPTPTPTPAPTHIPVSSPAPTFSVCQGKGVTDCCGSSSHCVNYYGREVCYPCSGNNTCIQGRGCVAPSPSPSPSPSPFTSSPMPVSTPTPSPGSSAQGCLTSSGETRPSGYSLCDPNNNKFRAFCDQGTWRKEDCSLKGAGYICQNGDCLPEVKTTECSPGEQRCLANGKTLEYCTYEGKWEEKACAGTCQNNTCTEYKYVVAWSGKHATCRKDNHGSFIGLQACKDYLAMNKVAYTDPVAWLEIEKQEKKDKALQTTFDILNTLSFGGFETYARSNLAANTRGEGILSPARLYGTAGLATFGGSSNYVETNVRANQENQSWYSPERALAAARLGGTITAEVGLAAAPAIAPLMSGGAYAGAMGAAGSAYALAQPLITGATWAGTGLLGAGYAMSQGSVWAQEAAGLAEQLGWSQPGYAASVSQTAQSVYETGQTIGQAGAGLYTGASALYGAGQLGMASEPFRTAYEDQEERIKDAVDRVRNISVLGPGDEFNFSNENMRVPLTIREKIPSEIFSEQIPVDYTEEQIRDFITRALEEGRLTRFSSGDYSTIYETEQSTLLKVFDAFRSPVNMTEIEYMRKHSGIGGLPQYYGSFLGGYEMEKIQGETLSEFLARGGVLTSEQIQSGLENLRLIHELTGEVHGDVVFPILGGLIHGENIIVTSPTQIRFIDPVPNIEASNVGMITPEMESQLFEEIMKRLLAH